MVYQAAWKNDQKQDIRNEAYMAKLFADENVLSRRRPACCKSTAVSA